MILSKLTTANKREAIAAPPINESATIFNKDAVFLTVSASTCGRVYAVLLAAVGDIVDERNLFAEDWQW